MDDGDETEISAYHEAGHALVAVIVGAKVLRVTIEPEWDDGPQRFADVRIGWPNVRLTKQELLEREVLIALAGPAAEMIFQGETLHPGFVPEWAMDWKTAWHMAKELVPDEKLRLQFLEQTTREVYHLLREDQNWAALAAIVDELLAHQTLESEQVHDVVSQWLR